MLSKLAGFSLRRPWLVVWLAILLTPVFALGFARVRIDTDPENMLPADEPVRVFHNQVKDTFGINDLLVLGVFNEDNPNGVFTPETLNRIYGISERIADIDGVIIEDLISPGFSDNMTSETGFLTVQRFMEQPISTREEAGAIRDAILDNPLYAGKLASEDGKALAIYVPIEKKDQSYRISNEIRRIVREEGGEEEYHVAGLPVAEDTFGYEMFIQMAISAPLAGLFIFLMLLWFFRRVSLILAPMIVAMLAIIWTMGLLTGLGFTVHIMSSMIPIFLMPIAVVDSVHILSEYHDCLPRFKDSVAAIRHVMSELFKPMLYTSLTSAIGFASLALTPIPPVRVFGLFVAFGIMAAWLLTITFIPAFIYLTSRKKQVAGAGAPSLAGAGAAPTGAELSGYSSDPGETPPLPQAGSQDEPVGTAGGGLLNRFGLFCYDRSKLIWVVAILLLAVAGYGMTLIVVNDNPVRWFKPRHEIRVADRLMNKHFAGTYSAYLVFEGSNPDAVKEPEVMNYIERLQERLAASPLVGKTSSLADVVKRVRYEVSDEAPGTYALPDTRQAISQFIFLFETSGQPDDLDNFVDYEYTSANIWVQLKSGDNQDMTAVVRAVEEFTRDNPPPNGFSVKWAGLTYLNVVWQHRMVVGMVRALLGAFVTVLILMVIIFRSVLWGILSMIPLTFTIAVSYGFVGLVGHDYDMPLAILSALTLGLSIDFAIHFVQRFRHRPERIHNARDAIISIFNGPARAIVRNAVIIAIGFTPLMLAPLVPYVTVGTYLFVIMLLSAVATLVLLPAAIGLFPRLFAKESDTQ